MKLIHEQYPISSTSATSRPWRAMLGALMWIGAGVAALFALCLLGPMLVTHVTSADLPIAVLAPLVSSIIASWDVGGLLLIMFGIRRLMTAWGLRNM
jgi:hypothetical protein